MTSCLFSEILNPFCKIFYSKKKEFAPGGTIFFPFKIEALFRKEVKQF